MLMTHCEVPGEGLKRACVLVLLFWAVLLGTSAFGQGRSLLSASAVAYDAQGNLYIADARQHRVLKATLAGALVPVAGSGVQGFAGDGGPATAAELNQPQGLAVGADGTLYVADTGNHRVRAVRPDGTMATVAGTGVPGFSGDGGSALAGRLRQPTALAVDAAGDLLLCDTGNSRVRRVAGGLLETVAGTGVQGFAGDGGAATAAELDFPAGLALAADGRIFVADTRNHRIRGISADGVITTIAGSGVRGYGGDGGQARLANLAEPRGLAIAADGGLVVADADNQRVRRIDSAGLITTVIGSGVEGHSADGAQGVLASVDGPRAVALSSFGFPVVTDTRSGAVQVLADAGALYAPAALAPARTSAVGSSGQAAWTYGQGTATVTVAGQAGAALGQVQALDGGLVVGSAPVTRGTATLDLGQLSAGTHPLTYVYLGDGLNPGTAGASTAVAVGQAPVLATASGTSIQYGQPLPTFSGTLSGVMPADVAAVQVSFGVGSGEMPAVGAYPIVASLSGAKAGNYAISPGQETGMLTVTKAGSVATLSATGPAYAGVPMTLMARVVSSTQGQPTGAVQFLDGGRVIGGGVLSGGAATLSYLPPAQGAPTLSVQYLGDGNFLPSTSAGSAIAVAALPDFAVSALGSGTASAAPGGVATFSVAVRSLQGPFKGAVNLSLNGLPAGATATFSPPQVVPDTGSPTVTISVETAQVSQQAVLGSGAEGRGLPVLLAGTVMFVRWRKRRAWGRLACLLMPIMLLTGCGARTVGEGLGGVISRSYALQLTATATNLAGAVVSHSVPLTLTIGP